MIWRVGNSLGTTIYRGDKTDDQQPVAIIFNMPLEEAQELALAITDLLNITERWGE